jgi:serine/threonine protein kinase
MVTSKLPEEEERPKSGESRKSNRSNGSSDEDKDSISRFIVLEFAENGDMFDFTVATGEAMGEELSRFYFHQLFSAVEYLHQD